MIEKELLNIILTGKKLFSEKQITYKFYLDPFEVEEKTKKFEKFTELYDRENLDDKEKQTLSKATENLKKIILPNLEILIFYLIKENKYQGKQKISEIKFHSNLYLNKNFIQLFSDSNNFTINKLVSIYEYMEEILWRFISKRYINQKYIGSGFVSKNREKINNFIDKENERELKNEMLISLLIKFICRYLPNEIGGIQKKDLFGTIQEKNTNLPEAIQKDLLNLKNLGAEVIYATEITDYLEGKIRINKNKEKEIEVDNKPGIEDQNIENPEDPEPPVDEDDRDID